MSPDKLSEPPKKPENDAFLAYGVYGAVGIQLAATVVGGLLLGQWLDKKWNISPWMTLAGMVVGLVGGFYNLIRITTWHQDRREKKSSKKDPS